MLFVSFISILVFNYSIIRLLECVVRKKFNFSKMLEVMVMCLMLKCFCNLFVIEDEIVSFRFNKLKEKVIWFIGVFSLVESVLLNRFQV